LWKSPKLTFISLFDLQFKCNRIVVSMSIRQIFYVFSFIFIWHIYSHSILNLFIAIFNALSQIIDAQSMHDNLTRISDAQANNVIFIHWQNIVQILIHLISYLWEIQVEIKIAMSISFRNIINDKDKITLINFFTELRSMIYP